MTTIASDSSMSRPFTTVSVGAVAWAVAAAIFVALRVAITWQAPVGGGELVHLAGAWNASIGIDDSRFVPTLFQGLSSWLLEFSSSPTPSRLLAFLATATIPFALYLLRPMLGQAGALLALVLLALDPVAIWLGSAATAGGFDVAIAAWLLVALTRDSLPNWTLAALGFLVTSAGPLPMLLGFAATIVSLLVRRYPSPRTALIAASGVLLAVVLASDGFGRGWEGVTIPPFALFGAAFEDTWSTATVADLTVFYSWPLVAAGGVAAIQHLMAIRGLPRSLRSGAGMSLLLVAWFAVGLAVLLASLGSHAEVPVVAATLPAALLAGRMLARTVSTLAGVRNPLAWLTLALVMFTMLLGAAIITDWARLEHVGRANETARVLVYGGAVLVLLAGIAWFREPLALIAIPLIVVGSIPVFSGAIAIATSAPSEPLPSPLSSANTRALRHVALETITEQGGVIAVHLDFEDDLTWALRDSGTVVVATEVPADASFVIWPANRPAPAGFSPATGTWSFVEQVPPPSTSTLRYLHWMVERHLIGPMPVPVAAYVRTTP